MALVLSQLSVSVEDTPVLSSIHMNLEPGSVQALMGPNGSGKSSMAYTLMGHPRYIVTQGDILLNGVSLCDQSPDKRARAGIFLAFQQPYEIPGVSVTTFLKAAYDAVTGTAIAMSEFKDRLADALERLGLSPAFAQRNMNEGFSGGEKKRFEMLQILLLKPHYIILDEIDSGLDSDGLRLIGAAIEHARKENPALSVLLITHYPRILEYVIPQQVHVLHKGRIIQSGTVQLAHTIEKKGYHAIVGAAEKK
jgi:Fe-S cluster assembly ATP-binding protein